jgi:hypothetical protein
MQTVVSRVFSFSFLKAEKDGTKTAGLNVISSNRFKFTTHKSCDTLPLSVHAFGTFELLIRK